MSKLARYRLKLVVNFMYGIIFLIPYFLVNTVNMIYRTRFLDSIEQRIFNTTNKLLWWARKEII